jgi:3-(3-hydroxy-phenyl)propionate hydroxylase
MNSGVHDAFDLFGELEAIVKHGASTDGIARYERRRRTVTHAFTQAQTIANMEYMKVSSGEAHVRRRASMQAIHDDPVKRRAYLKRQAMFESLEHASSIS